MSLDILNRVKREMVDSPVIKTASFDGAAVDALGCAALVFNALYGASGDTLSGTVYLSAKIEMSVDSGFTIPVDAGVSALFSKDGKLGANIFGLCNAPAEDEEIYSVGMLLNPDYRYYRVAYTFTGTHTNGIEVGTTAELQFKLSPPDTNLATPA